MESVAPLGPPASGVSPIVIDLSTDAVRPPVSDEFEQRLEAVWEDVEAVYVRLSNALTRLGTLLESLRDGITSPPAPSSPVDDVN